MGPHLTSPDGRCACLQAAWATAYTAIGTATGSTKEMITGQGSAFGAGLDAYHAAEKAKEVAAEAAAAETARKSTMQGKISDMRTRLVGNKAGELSGRVPPRGCARCVFRQPICAPAVDPWCKFARQFD